MYFRIPAGITGINNTGIINTGIFGAFFRDDAMGCEREVKEGLFDRVRHSCVTTAAYAHRLYDNTMLREDWQKKREGSGQIS